MFFEPNATGSTNYQFCIGGLLKVSLLLLELFLQSTGSFT